MLQRLVFRNFVAPGRPDRNDPVANQPSSPGAFSGVMGMSSHPPSHLSMPECLRRVSRCVATPEELPSLGGDDEHEEEEEPADIWEGPEAVEDREDLVVEVEEGSDTVEN